MDIDFIKWMCEKADGFDVIEDGTHVHIPSGSTPHILTLQKMKNWKNVLYPLLLQRAIEGVNRKFYCEGSRVYPWILLNTSHAFNVYHGVNSAPDFIGEFDFPCSSEAIDKAKESALKYIFDKEREG